MTKTKKKKLSPVWLALIVVFVLIDFVLLIMFLLEGKNVALFNPKGFIAQEQFNLMVYVVTILLITMIPTLAILYFTAWKYRETNTKAVHYAPTKKSKFPVLFMWVIPITIALVIASTMWSATHRLAPQKSIASDNKPITIQVVSLRWKWLFIYPEQQIATVNFIQIPINTPIRFELTADETPMSSFWIPNLGGQLYSMTSHDNLLNLMAETPGDYPGSSAEINGAGFAGMRFTARASSVQDFERWLNSVKQSPDVLDDDEYDRILVPSENNPVAFYSSFKNDLYYDVLMKYNVGSEHNTHSEDESTDDHPHTEKELTEGHEHN